MTCFVISCEDASDLWRLVMNDVATVTLDLILEVRDLELRDDARDDRFDPRFDRFDPRFDEDDCRDPRSDRFDPRCDPLGDALGDSGFGC